MMGGGKRLVLRPCKGEEADNNFLDPNCSKCCCIKKKHLRVRIQVDLRRNLIIMTFSLFLNLKNSHHWVFFFSGWILELLRENGKNIHLSFVGYR